MHLRVPILALLFGANLLFSGTPLIKSADGGRTWIDIDPGLPHQGVMDLQIAPDGSRLYALTVTQVHVGPFGGERRDYSVLSSSDAGRTWQELEPLRVTRAGFANMALAPSDPQTVYVASEDYDLGGSFRWSWVLRSSTDGGRTAATLTPKEEVLRPIMGPGLLWFRPEPLTVHPAISTTIFLGLLWYWDFDGLYFGTLSSADGGGVWQLSPKIGFTQFQAEPGEPSTLYARHVDPYENPYAPKRHVAKSTDGGKEWSLKLSEVSSFALDPRDPAVLLASKNDGSLWKSTDRAETWEHLGNWLPFAQVGLDAGRAVDRLVIHPTKPSLVLAQAPALVQDGLNTGDIFKSQNGGATWTVLPTGMDGFSFVFDPRDPDTIYGISEKRREPRLRPPYIRNLAGGSVLAPGSLFSIYGEDLAGGVTFNGQPADLLFVSHRQINGQVPVGLKPGAVVVEVLRERSSPMPRGRGGPAQVDRQSITLSPVAMPVILHDSSGAPHVYHLDSGRRIADADPAAPGERIAVYAEGLGAPETRYVQFWPTDRPATVHPVLFAEPVADQPGVYRVGIELPRSLGASSYLLLFWGGRNFARLEVR